MIQYDENTGDAAGLEKRLLVSEGFSPGVKVEIIEGHANEGSVFVIRSIDEDGLVKLHNDKDNKKYQVSFRTNPGKVQTCIEDQHGNNPGLP